LRYSIFSARNQLLDRSRSPTACLMAFLERTLHSWGLQANRSEDAIDRSIRKHWGSGTNRKVVPIFIVRSISRSRCPSTSFTALQEGNSFLLETANEGTDDATDQSNNEWMDDSDGMLQWLVRLFDRSRSSPPYSDGFPRGNSSHLETASQRMRRTQSIDR